LPFYLLFVYYARYILTKETEQEIPDDAQPELSETEIQPVLAD
jgi:hypothetical protein